LAEDDQIKLKVVRSGVL